MPQDSHEIFAALSDAEKKALLPADSVAEYLKDGRPAAKDDPKECVVDGKYVRPLRDYDVLFRADQEKRILLTDSTVAATWDKNLVARGARLGSEAGRRLHQGHRRRQGRAGRGRPLSASWWPTISPSSKRRSRKCGRPSSRSSKRTRPRPAKSPSCSWRPPSGSTGAPVPWPSPVRRSNSGVGIYDRDYYRQVQRPGFSSYAPRNVVVTLIAVNVAVWLIDGFFCPNVAGQGWLADNMGVHVVRPARPRGHEGHAHSSVALVAVSDRRVRPFAHGLRAYSRQYDRAVLLRTRESRKPTDRRSSSGCTW